MFELARWTLAAALAFAGAAFAADAPLRIVATSADLKSLVEAVGGDQVSVEIVAPPAGEPRAVELKASQILRLKGAALILRVGLDHEPWFAKMKLTAPVVDVSRGIELLHNNPRYLLDPANARPITATIVKELSKLRPASAAAFEENRTRFLEPRAISG